MRKFWLELPELLAALDLNGGPSYYESGTSSILDGSALILLMQRMSNSLYLTKVSGLGFERDDAFVYGGNLAYLNTSTKPRQIIIAGTLSFAGTTGISPYDKYDAFTQLIEGRRTSLRYSPNGGTYADAYILDGVITKLTKTEISGGILSCGFEFRGSAFWYKSDARTVTGSNLTEGSSIDITTFGADYETRWGVAFDVTLTATNGVTNPGAQFKYRDAVLAGFSVPGLSLAQNDVIRWCSDPANRLLTKNGVDVVGQSNISQGMFALLKQHPSLVIGGFNETMTGKMSAVVKLKTFRRSV